MNRTPPCPYFGICGGCNDQQIDHAQQLERKRATLAGMLSPYFSVDQIKVISGDESAYRNRMDFVFGDGGILGFRKAGRWQEIVDIETCWISDPKINHILTQVRKHFRGVDSFDVKKKSGTYRYAVIRTPKSGDACVTFILNTASTKIDEAMTRIESFAKSAIDVPNVIIGYCPPESDISIAEEIVVVKGTEWLTDDICGTKLGFSSQGFFQNNTQMANKMVEYAKTLLSKYDAGKYHLLDLYGGVGTFGVVLAPQFKSTLIVESVAPAIDAAKKNLAAAGITNGNAKVLDAKQLKKLDLPTPLIVINDPPRSGMHRDTIKELELVKPETIIYISCNPDQLRREIPLFSSYKVASVALFDLFPQTHHMEVIVELVKK